MSCARCTGLWSRSGALASTSPTGSTASACRPSTLARASRSRARRRAACGRSRGCETCSPARRTRGYRFTASAAREGRLPVERECAALVLPARWQAAQEALIERRTYASRNAFRDYLFRGLIVCEQCGCNYHGLHKPDPRGGKGWTYYTCNGKALARANGEERRACAAVNGDELEAQVFAKLGEWSRNPQAFADLAWAQISAETDGLVDLDAEIKRHGARRPTSSVSATRSSRSTARAGSPRPTSTSNSTRSTPRSASTRRRSRGSGRSRPSATSRSRGYTPSSASSANSSRSLTTPTLSSAARDHRAVPLAHRRADGRGARGRRHQVPARRPRSVDCYTHGNTRI
jgi:hypothetical protein